MFPSAEGYFAYPPMISSSMMAPSFSQCNVPLQPFEQSKDENYPPLSGNERKSGENFPPGTTCQQKPDSSFEDDESRKKYRERRDKNNMAAKRSRLNRKDREQRLMRQASGLEKENAELRREVAVLRHQAELLKKQYEPSFGSLTTFPYPTAPQSGILRENSSNLLPQPPHHFMYPSIQ